MIENTEAAAVAATVERLSKTETYNVDQLGDCVVVVPMGKKLASLKPYADQLRDAPERREGTAVLETLESFVDFMCRHANDHSVVYATEGRDQAAPKLVGVVDYNHAGPEGPARFGRHRAEYSFPLSDEWKAWKRVAGGGGMSQADFAVFVEDRLLDLIGEESYKQGAKDFSKGLGIALASPAALRDLGKGLRVRVKMHAGERHNVNTGETELLYSEAHEDSDSPQDNAKPLVVPGGFVLGIPVFRHGQGYQIPVRLRYTAKQKVTWYVSLHRPDLVFNDAFTNACKEVAEATGLKVLRGWPE